MNADHQDRFNYYFFDIKEAQEDIYELALYHNDLKQISDKENTFISLLNYYLKNYVRKSSIIDDNKHRLMFGLSIQCRSPIENFSEEELDFMVDVIREKVWRKIEIIIPVTFTKYPIGYKLINSGLLCLAIDKREKIHADTEDSYSDGGCPDSGNLIPPGGVHRITF